MRWSLCHADVGAGKVNVRSIGPFRRRGYAMLSRREVIGKAAVGAAAALAFGAARTGMASTQALRPTPDPLAGDREWSLGDGDRPAGDLDSEAQQPPTSSVAVSSPPPWELVSPLVAGSVVAHGWRLVDLSAVRDGSCIVTLQKRRRGAHRIHLCRNDGTPQGLLYTRLLDLVVMNGGKGDFPTEEGFAQAVARLAHVVAANEAKTPDRFFADFLPHTERVRRYAAVEGPTADGKLR